MVNPFQLKGVSFSQIVTISSVLYVGFIVSSRVAIESQPPMLVSVTDSVPALLITTLFQMYGNSEGQTEVLVVLESVF
jgi:hypothetical protein